jgi:molecular chaperone DnaJ
MQIRLAGLGDSPLQGRAASGDLFVTVHVQPSPIFTRKGADVFTTVDVDLITALLGGSVRVPTVDGDVDMKLPPGVQPNEEKVVLEPEKFPKFDL